MTIKRNIQTTNAVMGTFQELERQALPRYFTNLMTGGRIFATSDDTIDFAKIYKKKKLAPYVAPYVDGKPIYERKVRVQQFEPSYIKMDDPIVSTQLHRKLPNEWVEHGKILTPGQRLAFLRAEIQSDHLDALTRREEQMIAEAVLTGKVRVGFDDPDYPEVEVDYERDPGHTIVLTGAARWSDSSADPMKDINSWRSRIRRAKFGGSANILSIGRDVWPYMREKSSIRELMDTDIRLSADSQLIANLGLYESADVEVVARFPNFTIIINTETYEDDDGNEQFFMPVDSIALTAANSQAVMAYGPVRSMPAVEEFGDTAIPRYSREYTEGGRNPQKGITTESSPLPILPMPNKTLAAKVL